MNIPQKITRKWLQENKDYIFVFGDNLIHKGYGGAAALRDEPNTYGFVTKKFPDNDPSSFYQPEEYNEIYVCEMLNLMGLIFTHPTNTFLISKLGAGLANKYHIFEEVINPRIKTELMFENVIFLW